MFAHGVPAEKDELTVRNALPFSIDIKISEDVEGVFAWFIGGRRRMACRQRDGKGNIRDLSHYFIFLHNLTPRQKSI
jgi:hypothetical protein